MSIPQEFNVAVISGRVQRGGELATAVASLLAESESDRSPSFAAASSRAFCRPQLYSVLAGLGLDVVGVVPPSFIDPRAVDLWLALDAESESVAGRAISERGPAPKGFYRIEFPSPVVRFGPRELRTSRSTKFEDWLSYVATEVRPWRTRIWEAFSNSS